MKTSELGKWQDIADEAQGDVLYWKKTARQAQAERDELAEVLRVIAKYGVDGICPFGCDCPAIARAALAKLEDE